MSDGRPLQPAAVRTDAPERRLAAVVIADVVGYTALMERDDTGTFARLRSIRDEVVDPAIVSHGGRVVKTAGDGLLAEFSSALAALRASVQIQREMAARNTKVAKEDRIDYRIGVNLGDIMIDGYDIAGDGVNVASRLESIAQPGGICVSSAVREQVHGSLNVGFIDIGEQSVKNIARPIRAFALELDLPPARPSAPAVPASTKRRSPGRLAWMASLLTLPALGLVALWWSGPTPHASEPPAMSVGVLPLVARTDDAATAQRVGSLTRELTTQLALADVAIRAIPVAEGPSTATLGGMRAFARATNVRYLLEGDIQFAQDVALLHLRLINGGSGEQVWNETASLREPAIAGQARPLRVAMEHLRGRLFSVEMQRAVEAKAAPTAMDYVLRAYALGSHGDASLDQLRRQEALYEEALRLDPDLVPALIGVRGALDGLLDVDDSADRGRLIRRMDDVTTRAVNLNRTAPEAWAERSSALMFMGRWDAALEAISRAIELDPDAAWLVARRAWSMSMVGKPDEAVALVGQSIAMDPPGSWWTIRVGCEAHLLLGEYDRAIAECERAAGRGGSDFDIANFLAAAYGQKGFAARAAEEKAKILARSPGFTIAQLRAKRYSAHPDYVRLAELHWYSGLRKAGIPEN